MQAEDLGARARLGQRDVDALLEATSDGGVEHPRDVGGAQHQDTVVVGAHACSRRKQQTSLTRVTRPHLQAALVRKINSIHETSVYKFKATSDQMKTMTSV